MDAVLIQTTIILFSELLKMPDLSPDPSCLYSYLYELNSNHFSMVWVSRELKNEWSYNMDTITMIDDMDIIYSFP